MHVMEDAQWIELLDDTGASTAAGESGNIVCTRLYKHDVFPIIRFNTQDAPEAAPVEIEPICKAALRARLGVELAVRLTAPGSLAGVTSIETRQKPICLVDRRG